MLIPSLQQAHRSNNKKAITAAKKEEASKPVKRKGRPPKAVIETKKKGNRPVGRPKGDAAIMNEYKARLLASPKSKKVLDSILDAALNDEHKHQAAAWKLLVDRLMPISAFDKEAGGGKPMVEIIIKGLDSQVVLPNEPLDDDVIDMDDVE